MRRIDRLLLKVQEAQRLDENSLCYALVSPADLIETPQDSPNYNKWAVVAYLNKGKNTDGVMLDTLYYDTKAEALEAAKEIEAVHAPIGNKAKDHEAVYIIVGSEEDELMQQAEEASKVFEAQAEEATKAMSKNIPDYEGATL